MATLGRRTLNRTLLRRQWLWPRVDAAVRPAVHHLIGLQAQAPVPPYVGLFSRLRDFEPDDLARLLSSRDVVRLATLRGTVHLHTAADARPVRQWVQPLFERSLRSTRRTAWDAVDTAQLRADVVALVGEAPQPAADLGQQLQRRWPMVAAGDLTMFARCLAPLVQVPPRGLWGRSGPATYALADHWLADPAEPLDVGRLIERYLAAFGPASVRDVQAWAGVTRLAEAMAQLPLIRHVDESGAELFDVEGLPLAPPDADVPPVFIAAFDNLTLSHADRRRIIGDADRRIISSANGMIPGMVLLDGFVAATWRREGPVLQVTPFRRLTRRTAASLTGPGRDLLQFLSGTPGDVRLLPPLR